MHKYRVPWLVLLAVALSGCASAPFDYPRDASQAIEPQANSTLRELSVAWADVNGDLSGAYPLTHGNDALGARLRLLEQAEISIDAQYFPDEG